MNVAQKNWLDVWNTRAENRRQLLAQRLSREPVGPGMAALRAQFLKNAQTALNNRKGWAQVYSKHLEAVAQIVEKTSRTTAGRAPASKGSLGE